MDLFLVAIIGVTVVISFFVFKRMVKVIVKNLDDVKEEDDTNVSKSYNKPEDEIVSIDNKYSVKKGTDGLPKKRRGTDIEVAGFEEVYKEVAEKKITALKKHDIDALRDSSHFADIVDDLNENMRRGTNNALDGHYIEKKLKSEGKDFGRF
jgi:hypothetical protein